MTNEPEDSGRGRAAIKSAFAMRFERVLARRREVVGGEGGGNRAEVPQGRLRL